MTSEEIVKLLRAYYEMGLEGGEADPLIEAMHAVAKLGADEIERLQRIIDSRPPINAGLPESYVRWSQSIYVMELTHAQEFPS